MVGVLSTEESYEAMSLDVPHKGTPFLYSKQR
jgi:hypothetical protein